MKDWFGRLQPRERLMLIGGAAAAVVVILWGFIWMPLSGGVVELRDAISEKSRLVVDLRLAEALQAEPSGNTLTPADQSLVVLIDSTARSLGLADAFTRTRPDGPDAISVSFQNAQFDALLGWLVTLERNYGISVESASFNGARAAGLVSGQIFLRRL